METYSDLMRQVVGALTADTHETLTALGELVAGLFERTRTLSFQIQRGEDVSLDEILEVEQISTLAATANLLCEAHASSDFLLFGEAEIRAQAVASMLDQILEANRDGDPARMEQLRDEIGAALDSLETVVRGRH